MDFDKIKRNLQQAEELLDGWKTAGVDVLERDLALELLRSAYASLRFGTEGEEPQAARALQTDDAATVAVTAVAAESLPSEEPFPAESAAESAPVAEEEPAVAAAAEIGGTDSVLYDEVVVEDMQEVQGGDSEEDVRSDAAAGSDDVTVTGEAEESAASASETDILPEPEHEHEAEYESERIPDSVSETSSVEDRAYSVGVGSLFGDDEIAVSRKPRRVIMMSLYDDEPVMPRNANPTAVKSLASAADEFSERRETVADDASVAAMPAVGNAEPSGASSVSEHVPEEPAAIGGQEREEMEDVPEDIDDAGIGAAESSEPGAQGAADEVEKSPAETDSRPHAAPLHDVVPKHDGETVLGEVINTDVRTLADTIAPVRNVASEIARKESIDDIGRAVGVNDRFLLIRDLFGGDAAAYEAAVARLNGFGNFDDCMIYIAENYDWNPNSDGARLLVELIERKYS